MAPEPLEGLKADVVRTSKRRLKLHRNDAKGACGNHGDETSFLSLFGYVRLHTLHRGLVSLVEPLHGALCLVGAPSPLALADGDPERHGRALVQQVTSIGQAHAQLVMPLSECWKVGWWWSKCCCLPALSFTPDSSSPAYVPAVSLGVGAQTLHTRHPDPQAPDVPQTSRLQSPNRRAPTRRPSVRTIQGRPSVRSRGGGHLNAPQTCNPTPSPVLPPVSSRRPRRRIHALPPAPLAGHAPTAVAHSLLPPLGACQSPRPRTGRLRNRHRP